jgi:DNA-binding transcriptional MerR regulator
VAEARGDFQLSSPQRMSAADSTPPDASQPEPQEFYSIEMVAEITHTPRHLIAVYCRHGLVAPIGEPESSGWQFDDDAIHKLRRLEFLREKYGMNLSGLRIVSDLLRDVERLREELRFLHRR